MKQLKNPMAHLNRLWTLKKGHFPKDLVSASVMMMILLMMLLIMIKGPGYQIKLNKGALHQARSSTHPNTTLHGTVVVVYRHVRAPGPCNGQISRNLLCVELQTWKNLRFMVCSACFPTKNLPSPNVCARVFHGFSTFLPHFCHLFPWRFQWFSRFPRARRSTML